MSSIEPDTVAPEPSHMIDYRSLLERFHQAIQARMRAEHTWQQQYGQGPDQTEKQLVASLESASTQRTTELAEVDAEHARIKAEIDARFLPQISNEKSDHVSRLHGIESQAARESTTLEQQKNDSEWVVTSVLDDTADDSPRRELDRFSTQIHKVREEQVAEWTDLEHQFKTVQEERGWKGSPPEEPERRPRTIEETQEWFNERVEAGRKQIRALRSLIMPKLFLGVRSLVVYFIAAIAIGIPFYLFVEPSALGMDATKDASSWAVASAVSGAAGGLLLTLVMYTLASMQQSDAFRRTQQLTAEVNWLHQIWLGYAREQLDDKQAECEKRQRAMIKERENKLRRFEETHTRKLNEIQSRRDREIREEEQRHAQADRELNMQMRNALTSAEDTHQQARQAIEQYWIAETSRTRQSLADYQRDRQRAELADWSELKNDWMSAYNQFHSSVAELNSDSQLQFPAWDQLSTLWMPSGTTPSFLKFGDYALNLETWPGAISEDMRLAPRVTEHVLPALLPFPEQSSALFKIRDAAGREAAVAAMRTLALRLLAMIPPGKIRFTILDPVGLGESFAGLMHLADFDELMVTHRIWTEPGQIETQLADLTGHMENVLQKYLRNEFQTIEEYNAAAGEVAEPYHFLIISDFPSKFSDLAARRLVSIINSGPRCGVYTLMSTDETKQLPHNFTLADVEPAMECFVYRGGAFHAEREDMAYWPIKIESPPNPELFTRLVRKIGEASKDARRVEVAFQRIAPKPGEFWSRDSRREIEVPLGRAGATKLQTAKLGRGTSQHMLVAGKTGSGKSTYLHILITNLALYYSPNEINFYLIDFKKGVEFKDYASEELPHARVVAIESDREFGVSTLQRLDAILQERGELFRRHGVQDIAGFRNANPNTPLPRILLIVDEFQEFFIEDDKLSQSASLLLDRLVRQGRAFGMHVVLGSQTLGGAYSLARSTLGQVAIRVALQCSESDAHLILSEENTAARLLTRPGEAIYNDANGLSEGNNPFQIAWLDDEERNQALRNIRQQATRQGIEFEKPIVFEGNIPSDITRNQALETTAAEFGRRETPVAYPSIWLGDPVEIGPPPAITFYRQGGNNLLMVGQDAEAAQGIQSAAALAWLAGGTPTATAPTVYLLDGSLPDTVEAETWNTLLANVGVNVRHVTPRDSVTAMSELAAELKRREENSDVPHPPILQLVYNVAKFRDLRKGEDDYGMGSFGAAPAGEEIKPEKVFADLIVKGPEHGIHTIAWADSYNNVDRWFSRQTLREMEQRIAFQMNGNDSSSFIDSPAASRLGPHRALLYREETGTLEKFRPYGVPTTNWLASFKGLMQNGEEPEVATDLGEFNIL
ncbi:MAG: cell division protein FtsK [Planctomycetaceae bacterium]|nr:cell division protein FtsK [Planctomycetaceae bacterium]